MNFWEANRKLLVAAGAVLAAAIVFHFVVASPRWSKASKIEEENAGGFVKFMKGAYKDDGDKILTQLYGVELETKYSITSKLSVTAMGRYERSKDETEYSTDNYHVGIGGLHVTYLF